MTEQQTEWGVLFGQFRPGTTPANSSTYVAEITSPAFGTEAEADAYAAECQVMNPGIKLTIVSRPKPIPPHAWKVIRAV